MVNKLVLLISSAVFITSAAVSQAATRTNAPLEMAKIQNPDSEKKCLEAFVSSKFSYAHRLCLSLAQQGMRDAQLVTGLMYAFGEGTKKNAVLAELWLNEAARNGSMEAKEVLDDIHVLD
ncbi:hypothetical protein MNBD_ALPHA03-380 [hydrothermal vent metagenome]|uniref:Sel1 repeat family protein n=1 Tax=hydrothermal vent metagenome TaxID=652676 RepID=A0A3B1B413_9ZZZZ